MLPVERDCTLECPEARAVISPRVSRLSEKAEK